MKKILLKIAKKLLNFASSDVELSQKEAEKLCIDAGHLWSSSFDPGKEIKKPLKERVYCRRCGKVYSEIHYKK